MVKAVILGTGRSGSGYIAQALTACGIPCGHESVFTSLGYRPNRNLVDSSWMGICYPHQLPNLVWHQVRHPELVLRSRITAPKHEHQGGYGVLKRQLLPPTGDPVADAMRWYVTWNLACERYAERRWRVEDVNEELVETIATQLGVDCDPTQLHTVATDANRHTQPDHHWTLDDLPLGADRDAVYALAGRYGYQL